MRRKERKYDDESGHSDSWGIECFPLDRDQGKVNKNKPPTVASPQRNGESLQKELSLEG